MDFPKDILEEKGAELATSLVNNLGFNADRALAFVPEAAHSLLDVVKDKAGDLDLSDLSSNAGTLSDGVDTDALAAKVGISSSQATLGLNAIVPTLLAALQEKAGGLSGLRSMLGGQSLGRILGGGAAVGDVVGKLFSK